MLPIIAEIPFAPPPGCPAPHGQPMDITQLLAFSVKNKASDLHLSAGLPPMIRVHGDVRRINVAAAGAQAGARHGVRHHERRPAQALRGHAGVRLLVRDPGPGALPRQRLQPEPRRGRGVPDHSEQDPDAGAAQLPQGLRRAALKPRGLVLVTGPPARASPPRWRPWSTTSTRTSTATSSRWRTRSSSCTKQEVPDQPARGRPAHAELRQRAALGAARGPGRHPGGRNARPGNHPPGADRGRDRPPGVRHAAHLLSAAKTIDRMVDVFPAAEKEMVRAMLSESLRR
jgi:twitching motility protein PilT